MESRGNQGTLKPSLGGRGSRQLVKAAFMNQDHTIVKTTSNSRPPNQTLTPPSQHSQIARQKLRPLHAKTPISLLILQTTYNQIHPGTPQSLSSLLCSSAYSACFTSTRLSRTTSPVILRSILVSARRIICLALDRLKDHLVRFRSPQATASH